MQSSFNPDEYIQYEYILKRTHALKQLEHIDISEHVKQGIRQFEYFQDVVCQLCIHGLVVIFLDMTTRCL